MGVKAVESTCSPAQAVREAIGIEELPPIVPAEEDATMPAA